MKYKVVKDFPGNNIEVGTELKEQVFNHFEFKDSEDRNRTTQINDIDKYPHIYKKVSD